jgi:hypothetical protein
MGTGARGDRRGVQRECGLEHQDEIKGLAVLRMIRKAVDADRRYSRRARLRPEHWRLALILTVAFTLCTAVLVSADVTATAALFAGLTAVIGVRTAQLRRQWHARNDSQEH